MVSFNAILNAMALCSAASAALHLGLYQNPNFGGDNVFYNPPNGACQTLPNRWLGAANSAKVSGGSCNLYSSSNCQGRQQYISGSEPQISPPFSFACYEYDDF